MNQIIKVILQKIGEAIEEIEVMEEPKNTTVRTFDPGPMIPSVAPPATAPPAVPPAMAPPMINTHPGDPSVLPPVAPPAMTPPTIGPVDVDGLPWDPRINSGAKSFLKNGSWKLLRGVDSVLVAQVKSELAGMVRSEPLAQAPHSTQTPTPIPPPIPPPIEQELMTWSQLMEAIATAALDPAIVIAACQKHSVANIGILQDFPDLVPNVAAELGV